MRSRPLRMRTSARLLVPICAIAAAVAGAHCGLLGSPGEYGGTITEAAPDGGADGTVATDGPVNGDGSIVLPDGNVIPSSIGTIAVLAGERDPTSAEDNPAWTADAWSALLGPDGRVATWRIDQSAPLIGSFDTGTITDGRWFVINTGFGIAGGRSNTIQSTLWSPGIGGDWKGARAPVPGGLDDHARIAIGIHVFFVGGTRTVTFDGGTNTFFTKEVHVADINVTLSELANPANTGIELVTARARPGVLFHQGHLYVAGGRAAAPNGITGSVERSAVNVTIGNLTAFADQPALKVGAVEHRVFGPSMAGGEGYVFVAGGRTTGTGTPTDVVLSAKIDPATGDLAEWKSVTSLPQALRDFAFVAFKKRLYVIGGITAAGTRTRDVVSAAINPDGTIGPWDNTNAKLPAARSDMVTAAY